MFSNASQAEHDHLRRRDLGRPRDFLRPGIVEFPASQLLAIVGIDGVEVTAYIVEQSRAS